MAAVMGSLAALSSSTVSKTPVRKVPLASFPPVTFTQSFQRSMAAPCGMCYSSANGMQFRHALFWPSQTSPRRDTYSWCTSISCANTVLAIAEIWLSQAKLFSHASSTTATFFSLLCIEHVAEGLLLFPLRKLKVCELWPTVLC